MTDVVREKLRDGSTVELIDHDDRLYLVIDDVAVSPVSPESFEYPVLDYDVRDAGTPLVDAALDKRRRRRFERRKERLRTADHAASEGLTVL